ncbi:MAG: helix-turn-helix domain-containing protein [Clostridia bacterium]|jgi:AraC family transcriptional regulator|nr:helix-turn-helix domain-containing protein [Clostridiaceae bacterium]
MMNQMDEEQKNFTKSFESCFENQTLLAKVIEQFPYPIQIFSLDGTAQLINRAALEMIGIRSVETHVGKYNVFRDPVVRKLGYTDQVREVLKGNVVHISDFYASYRDLVRYFNVVDRDIQSIHADITCFPLANTDGRMEYFAVFFIFKKVYRGKEEIARGRQYLDIHWQEPFDLQETAKAACLSKAQFTKVFKKHMGITPHEYYRNIKIEKLKEKLLDPNLSVAQAFAACNMNYNGHSAKMFKEKTGVSPSVYRRMSAAKRRDYGL